MFKIYAVLVDKESINDISAKPYNLIIRLDGYTYLSETTKEEANNFVYYLLEDIDNKEIMSYQNNIVVLKIYEIRDKKGKVLIK